MRLLGPSRPALRSAALTVAALVLTGCASAMSATPESPDVQASASGAVWVANEHDDSVTVLDPESGEPIATLTGIDAPHNVQASATRNVVWVTGTGGVVALDATELYPTDAAPAGNHAAHVVETGAGTVFVSAAGDGVVHQFDNTLEPIRSHDVGEGPHGMRISADGTLAAVANTDGGSVTLLRPATGTRARTVEVGPSPIQVAISEDGSTVFVAVAGTREVLRVDVASGEVSGRVRVGSAPAQIWLTSDGTVLSADQGSPEEPGNTVSVIDGQTMTVTKTIRTGAGPHGLTVNPEETRAWVTNAYDDSVTVIDLVDRRAVKTVEVGAYPNGITYTEVTPTRPEHDPVRLVLPHAFSHPEEAEHSHTGAEEQTEDGDHGHDH